MGHLRGRHRLPSTLRKGVKWHSSKAFNDRDFNADDVIFAIERMWKEDHPFFKVTSPNHSYFNDMGLPEADQVGREGRRQHDQDHADAPRGAVLLSDLAMEYAGIQSKEYADAMLKGRHAREDRPGRSAPARSTCCNIRRTLIIRYRAFPEHWRGKAKLDDLVFAITPDASVRWAKLRRANATSCRIPIRRTWRRCARTTWPSSSSPASISATSPTTPRRSPSTTSACAMPSTWRQQEGDRRRGIPRKRNSGVNPIPPSMWSYNETIKDDPYDPEAAKKLLAEAGFPNGLETDIWAMPVQRPIATPAASPS